MSNMRRDVMGVKFEISRIPLTGVMTRLGWMYRAENVNKINTYNASGLLKNVPFFIP